MVQLRPNFFSKSWLRRDASAVASPIALKHQRELQGSELSTPTRAIGHGGMILRITVVLTPFLAAFFPLKLQWSFRLI